jgi:glycosyltransferase involved in cell wall biosynthesis
MNATRPDRADVKVSVAMITYNHEAFIAQAIDSVLMQQTDFEVELVIGEDCSPDGTRSIVRDYAEKHPGIIKALLHPQNLGPAHGPGKNNLVSVLRACRGQYIALLEGDDYWTDPLKLQKQVEFLEAHPECAICFHNVMVTYMDQQRTSHFFCPPDQKEISTLKDLLINNFIPTCSVIYRRGLFGEIPNWFHELPIGDWPLHVLNAQYGHIGYLDEGMAVFRIHAGGIWSSRDTVARIKQWLPMYGPLYGHLGEAHGTAIRSGASKTIAAGAAAIFEADETNSLASSLEFVRTALVAAAGAGYANRSFVRVTKARSYEALGFTAYRRRDMRIARYCYARALAFDPALARNKGILSLWFEACIGERASAMRKSITSRLLRDRSLL